MVYKRHCHLSYTSFYMQMRIAMSQLHLYMSIYLHFHILSLIPTQVSDHYLYMPVKSLLSLTPFSHIPHKLPSLLPAADRSVNHLQSFLLRTVYSAVWHTSLHYCCQIPSDKSFHQYFLPIPHCPVSAHTAGY